MKTFSNTNQTMIELNTSSLQCIFCKSPYPGAVCDEGVDVVFGLVVVEQTAPGHRSIIRNIIRNFFFCYLA